ncbi:MAG: FAD-dependent oxidoreductase, partial [Bacteroidales bacterium]|nr:FAD-dependent oxidoreductase [Bacteroidales bacterium]
IENFPGYPEGVDGNQMMDDLRQQCVRFGTEIRSAIAVKTDLSQRPFTITFDDDSQVQCKTLIVATGASAKYLGLADEEKYRGQGVSACATCDGFFYRKKTVAVVGGGDTACEEATYLASLCKKVYLVVRRNVLRASDVMQKRVLNTENIEILWETQTKEIVGDDMGVNGVILVNKAGEEIKKDIDGFFLAIGHHPNSEVFSKWVNVDSQGYIVTDGVSSRTKVSGVFAAGDVQDPHYRQGIVAAGSGCKAAMDAEKFLANQN